MSTAELKYRADIDGLRAISVLAVIAYHAGLGFTGGYVGVDVFFVISGFLITSLIAKDLERGTFGLGRFWERRIRRIWPAAMATTLGVLVAGFVLMLPASFMELANSAIAQVLLVANLDAWMAAGYFVAESETRPLLHMWSLAVEEQFYILFPPLLMLIWRLGRRLVLPFLLIVTAASLILSMYAAARHPEAAFYLLPTRIWELMVGAVLAIWRPRAPKGRLTSDALVLSGLLMIALSALLYDEVTLFPGLAASPPCIGAALVVYAGAGQGRVSRMISIEPLRVLGLMSYSLYLVHWPVLAFGRYLTGEGLSGLGLAVALAATGALAFLSWRFVETPIRHIRSHAGLKHVAVWAGVASVVMIGLGLSIRHFDGLPSRFPAPVLAYGSPAPLDRGWETGGLGTRTGLIVPIGSEEGDAGPAQFLLWGDSHAVAVSPVFDEIAKRLRVPGASAVASGRPPVPGAWRPGGRPRHSGMRRRNDRMLGWIQEHKPPHVVLCARWSVWVDGRAGGKRDSLLARDGSSTLDIPEAMRAVTAGLQRILDVCSDYGGTVWFLHEVPLQRASPESRAAWAHLTGEGLPEHGVDLAAHRRQQSSIAAILASPALSRVLSIDCGAACIDETGYSRVAYRGTPLYQDDDHLSPRGVEILLGEALEAMLTRVASESADSALRTGDK